MTTPVELAAQYVDKEKHNEKTLMLVNSLPNEKCAVLAYDHNRCDEIKKALMQERPEYNLDKVTFLVYLPNSGWRDKLLFRDMHVFMDHVVLDVNNVGLTKSINDVYGKRIDE